MSTPFEYIRRHQKVALTAVTGMAILSFLLVDASNGGQLSPLALGSLIVGCFALVGWVWGTSDGKSSENAIFGGVLGLALTLVFMFLTRAPAAVTATSGNISANNLGELGRERSIANRMVNLVYYGGNPNAGFLAQFQLPRFMFGFGIADQTNDVVFGELLNREARTLGIEVTDDAVMNYLKEVAGKDSDGAEQLTKKVYSDAIKNACAGYPGASENTVIDAIRHEMRARQAANILLGGNRMTPSDVWELHRKLNTRESAQFVAIPVESFIDKNAMPTDAELAEFFNKYKGNYPNSLPNGQLEEGRPGLFLQRRVRVAYVEPNYEELEKAAGEITEEEIKKRYEERYMTRAMPENPHGELNLPDLPLLPKVPAAPEGTPAEKPAEPATDKPAEEKPAEPAAPAAEEKPAAPAAEENKPADPAAPAPDAKPEEPAKPDGTSFRTRTSRLQPVALLEDTPAAPADKPAEAAPAAAEEKPAEPAAPAAEEKPAEQPTEKPAEEKPAEATDKPADSAPLTVPPVPGEAVTDEDPAPPSTTVRPLDEVLRQQIRDELLAEKTRPLVEAKVNAARDLMSDLHLGVSEYLNHQRQNPDQKTEFPQTAISPEEATKRLQEHASQNGLTYTETPLMTLEELLKSEDHSLGGAQVGRMGRVIDNIHQSKGEDLYFAATAFDLAQKGSYAFWKIEDVAAHEPKSLEEPGMKDKTIQAWRQYKARPAAEKRAQELVDLITKSGKPFAEALTDQTVTGEGQDKSIFVTVKSTGDFSWLQRSMAPSQFGQDNSPRFGTIQGVEGVDEKFMAKVFNEMKPGETAFVPNFDRSVVYVMQIEKRTPSTEAEISVMQKQFLESQGELAQYAANVSRSHDGNFFERLFVKHGVKMTQSSGPGEAE